MTFTDEDFVDTFLMPPIYWTGAASPFLFIIWLKLGWASFPYLSNFFLAMLLGNIFSQFIEHGIQGWKEKRGKKKV